MALDQIKVPRHSPHSRVERGLKKTPQDGAWHQIAQMGLSSAEQTARAYNVPGGRWELGYTLGVDGGVEVSYLWAKWVG
jgi:hypothetical protein